MDLTDNEGWIPVVHTNGSPGFGDQNGNTRYQDRSVDGIGEGSGEGREECSRRKR